MKLRTFEGNQFSWTNSEGCACASDLGIRATDNFPDSFYIRSHKTGDVKLFLPAEQLYAQDGEWVGAKYFVPAGGVTVTIFND